MEPVRCPSCNRSLLLIGIVEEPFELVLFCTNCGVTLQIEMKDTEEPCEDDGTGMYL